MGSMFASTACASSSLRNKIGFIPFPKKRLLFTWKRSQKIGAMGKKMRHKRTLERAVDDRTAADFIAKTPDGF